nr:DAK2 domain-containing protein [Arsenicicoccus piscis]
MLRWAVLGRAALASRRTRIDALNVFPVPDGDTGTNMFLTLDSAVEAMIDADRVAADDPLDLTGSAGDDGQAVRTFSREVMLAARGNSGVIMSQLIRGLADVVVEHAGPVGPAVVAAAMREASTRAYASVGSPTEGTILTVARIAAESAEQVAGHPGAQLLDVVTAASESAYVALAETPDQLPALSSAGVVDAGAAGLVILLDALRRVVEDGGPSDHQLLPAMDDMLESLTDVDLADEHDLTAGRTGCAARGSGYSGPAFELMALVRGGADEDLPRARRELAELGDSVVVMGDAGLWRVHVHVDDTDAALVVLRELGDPDAVEITPLVSGTDPDATAVVQCASGEGLVTLLRDAGAVVVESSAGRRASIGQVLAALHGSGAGRVLLLPNDSDLVLASEAAAEDARATGLDVVVVPSRSVVQGLAAQAVVDPAADFAESRVVVEQTVAATGYGEVTVASRDADTAAGPCRAGDVLGLVAGEIVEVGDSLDEVARDVVDRLLADGGELVTALGGQDCPDESLDRLAAHVGSRQPAPEITVHQGGFAPALLLLGVE